MSGDDPDPQAGRWVVGIDVGGSGIRFALAPGTWPAGLAGARTRDIAAAAQVGAAGHDADALLAELLPALDALVTGLPAGARIGAVAVGATGMALLGRDLAAGLPGPLARATGAEWLVLAGDAVTAYAGALGTRPGVVVAAGTGLVAVGHHPDAGWRRADGWGQLLGDCGSGGWIGRAGLEAALRAYDGRTGGSPALLAAAERRYGPVAGLPAALQPRPDRAALLAAFAPDVATAAEGGCPVADGIVRRAAEEVVAAATAAASAAGLAEPRLALTGGLFRLARLRGATHAALAARLPGAHLQRPDGPPLLGALRLAATAATGLPWPVDPPLLDVLRVP
ncbi:ATPase [Kitasatospora sp. RG8]|uniref:BadF/BadG/BcrA/BcrD ATPase family protein n=1 Tax=Kitasatospora sp. RG8 TaxID=2820815 RepID=UPI001ADFDE67|nr:BadF/BadG/BcrA/BcrD ATPase family protein [Kitasatospora sp. RG8]MBP0449315.1 ATPase [Kitasatospora sp. RG8]